MLIKRPVSPWPADISATMPFWFSFNWINESFFIEYYSNLSMTLNQGKNRGFKAYSDRRCLARAMKIIPIRNAMKAMVERFRLFSLWISGMRSLVAI